MYVKIYRIYVRKIVARIFGENSSVIGIWENVRHAEQSLFESRAATMHAGVSDEQA